MYPKILGFLLVTALAVSACVSQTGSPQTEPEESPTPASGDGDPNTYPGPDTPVQGYPGIDTGNGSGTIDPAYLSPQPGDEQLARSVATVEIADSEMLVMESYPIQVAAILRGYLPNPCHKLRAVIGEPDAQNNVEIEVYSVVDPDEMCIEVIEPFEVRLPLGSYQGGTFQFFVNGELLGEAQG